MVHNRVGYKKTGLLMITAAYQSGFEGVREKYQMSTVAVDVDMWICDDDDHDDGKPSPGFFG